VSTCDKNGHVNLAPFSYFNALASDPMMLTISIARRRDGTDKDSLRIAKETGVFCVNLVEAHDLTRMNQTSAELAPDESEAERFNIETVPCAHIAGVRIQSARAAFECTLKDVHVYGNKAAVSLVVGEVKGVYVDDAIYAGFIATGGVGADVVDPVARLGGANYAMLGQRLTVPRP
jgi:flavin reductase (DIM6/NTAB) family NADH-FMN oxidoreductase RutF